MPGARGDEVVRRLDRFQQRWAVVGFPHAVLCKYLDDEGPRLAALMTYYWFLSLFPLLLLAVATVSETLRSRPALEEKLLDELVVPALRPTVDEALAQMPSSGVPLLIGALGLLYSGSGGVVAVYIALNQIWVVPWRDRYGFARRYRGVFLMILLGFVAALGVAGTSILADMVFHSGTVTTVAGGVATAGAAFGILVSAHKLLVSRHLRLGQLWVGCALGAVAVSVLLTAATTLIPALAASSGLIYGSFATVVGVFTLLYLVSQVLVVSLEVSAVLEIGLTPRGLSPRAPTVADVRAFVLLARQQERTAEQQVVAVFRAAPETSSARDEAPPASPAGPEPAAGTEPAEPVPRSGP
jgi:uncharacterized BrkB/YihY/UPF0761 family membrane protein